MFHCAFSRGRDITKRTPTRTYSVLAKEVLQGARAEAVEAEARQRAQAESERKLAQQRATEQLAQEVQEEEVAAETRRVAEDVLE